MVQACTVCQKVCHTAYRQLCCHGPLVGMTMHAGGIRRGACECITHLTTHGLLDGQATCRIPDVLSCALQARTHVP